MALHTITRQEGESSHFIPRRARFSVYTVPDCHLVQRGTTAGKEIHLDLDPGRYRVKIVKNGVCNWDTEFLVGLTETQYKVLNARKVKHAKIMLTTEGVRYRCKVGSCQEQNMTTIGAIMHEWEAHYHLDPLKATPEEIEDILSGGDSSSLEQPVVNDEAEAALPVANLAGAAEMVRRRPGRPPSVKMDTVAAE